MAQIEIVMYIALGFATAALIALLLGRLMWTLALSVGRRRAQRTAPPAVAELQAERNQLRAEYAMLARRVEVRLDELRMQVAEHMAEVSRSRNRIDLLGKEIETRDASLAQRDTEIARLKEHIARLESELQAQAESLHQRDEQIERLRAKVDQLDMARSEAASRERTAQERLKGRIEDLSALSRQIEAQRRQLLIQKSQPQELREAMGEQHHPDRHAHFDGPDQDPQHTAGIASSPELESDQTQDPPVERRVEDVDLQPSELQSELDRLDEIWSAKLADVAQSVASESASDPALDEGEKDAAVVNGSASKSHGREIGRDDSAEVDDADQSGPTEDGKKLTSGIANVISLAQRRIRALQRNGS
jgi:chromosome segregation ATPase